MKRRHGFLICADSDFEEEDQRKGKLVSSCTKTLIEIDGIWMKRNSVYFDTGERCHDCGIVNKNGNYHHHGCDVERCPKCGGQIISCACKKGSKCLCLGQYAAPRVIDIHAVNGKRPEFDVYIGRAVKNTEFTVDSKWANKHRVENHENIEECLAVYESEIRRDKMLMNSLHELTDKKLGCWCVTTSEQFPLKCHGQILAKLWIEMFCERKRYEVE